ncbi:MAG: hypothetical protein DRQ88_06100 [Epsilonproteobacteria bacterium]|nr:MAG: hypothetical protein DRQ88_06100 [Campylobacterota bacterium]
MNTPQKRKYIEEVLDDVKYNLRVNADALDNDLEHSWNMFKLSSKLLKILLDEYIHQGEKK